MPPDPYAALDRTELALLVVGRVWGEYEENLCKEFERRETPYAIALNKADIFSPARRDPVPAERLSAEVIETSATGGEGIDRLRKAIVDACPSEFLEPFTIIGDLVGSGDLVVLVTPIDLEAPKGRLILPQVQTLRDVLDNNAFAVVAKESELAAALESLQTPPRIVVTDSQAFESVGRIVPRDIPLTGFSILYARVKGDLNELYKGVATIDQLESGSRVLIGEACSHHPVEDDIGHEKIPRWLREYTGNDLTIDVVAGRDFPEDVSGYDLIIHCGACVFNRKALLSPIEKARIAGVPITNYGVAIAFFTGILDRAMEPFRLEAGNS